MLNSLATRWHTGDSISSYSLKHFEANIERKILPCEALLSKVKFFMQHASLKRKKHCTTLIVQYIFCQYYYPDNKETTLQDKQKAILCSISVSA